MANLQKQEMEDSWHQADDLNIFYTKRDGQVYVQIYAVKLVGTGDSERIFLLPEGYRPSRYQNGCIYWGQPNYYTVYEDGWVTLRTNSPYKIAGAFSFPV